MAGPPVATTLSERRGAPSALGVGRAEQAVGWPVVDGAQTKSPGAVARRQEANRRGDDRDVGGELDGIRALRQAR